MHRVAGLSAAVLVVALIVLTGGEDSPFEFLVLPVLLHAALACGRPWVLVEGSMLLLVTAASPIYEQDASAVAVVGDVGDTAVWTAVAMFVTWMRDRLQRNEQRNRSLFDQHPDSVSARDRWGTIERMNPAASSLVGLARDDLVQRDWTDFVPPGRLEETQQHFITALKGQPTSFETQLVHADGHLIDVAFTFIPIVVDGRVTGVYHISKDISERVQAQSALALFRRVLDQITDGVIIWGRDGGTISYANPAAASIFGLPTDELRATEPAELTDAWDPARLQTQWQHTGGADDEGARAEFEVRRRDGTDVPVESVTQRVSAADGEAVFVAVLRDMSAHRETQRALRAALETEQASTERLRAVNEMQKTFLQAVSHELRTPLTSIAGYAQALAGRWADLPHDKVEHMLDRVDFNAKRLAGMLRDLLDVDRLSRGAIQLTLTGTDLGALCRQVVDQIEVGGRSVQVQADMDVTVDVDRPKVERIVENLIYNSIKHTPDGTLVRVRAEPYEGGGLITVEDDGPGIPPALRETIFEPFRQGPTSASSASPGTGIGLALVARFSSLHGGRAWVEDAPGGGAAFKVFLPCEPPADAIGALGVVASHG